MKIIKKIKRKLGSPKTRPLITNNGPQDYPPLRFHRVHGENVRIAPDGSFARRSESFCRGIAFGNRPVDVDEPISIRFVELSTFWSGALRFGFTSLDPSNHRNSGLPKYACPDLTSKSGFWAKALAERYAAEDTILTYWVTQDGDVKYSINGQEKGVFFSGVSVSGRLWPLLDIYGNTTCIEFNELRPRQLNNGINRLETTRTTQTLLLSPSATHLTSPLTVQVSQGHYEVISPAFVVQKVIIEPQQVSQIPLPKSKFSPTYSTLSSAYSCASSQEQECSMTTFKECTICYEKPINSVLYMCGHMCMCYECAYKQWKGKNGGQCPICRATILDVIKTYWS